MKTVDKVWGKEEWIVNNGLYCGKRMFLKKGALCSLHMHPKKHETFFVESGRMRLELNDITADLGPGISAQIQPGHYHRFAGYVDTVFFEFSTQHDEEDVVRRTESYLTPILWVFDIDGTFLTAGGPVMPMHVKDLRLGILSSRSVERSLEVCGMMGIKPDFVHVCRVMGRAEELKRIDGLFPIRRTIYVADQPSDREEALRAGWEHLFPTDFVYRAMKLEV